MDQKPILFIQTAFLGDLCLSVPTLKRIRVLRPNAPIWLVARKGFGSFMKELGVVDRVFEIEKKDRRSYQHVGKELGKHFFEWIVCPHQSVTSARLIWPLKAEKKIGYVRFWNSLFFSDRVMKPVALPEAFRQLALLGPVDSEIRDKISAVCGIDWNHTAEHLPAPPDWALGELPILPRADGPPSQRCVAIFPGSVWATKKWTQEGFQRLAQMFEANSYSVLLMGSSAEVAVCEEIQNSCKNAINLAGTNSLIETLRLIKDAALVISNDSGGSHLASIAGTPTLSIFGPTVIGQGFRPWVKRGAVSCIEDLGCRPCGAHGHQKCPLGTHECMKGLTAEKVFSVAQKLL